MPFGLSSNYCQHTGLNSGSGFQASRSSGSGKSPAQQPSQSSSSTSITPTSSTQSDISNIRQNRVVNPPKAESPIWRNLKPYRGQYKTDAKGEKIYEWDCRHNDIEVYKKFPGNKMPHLGTMDPMTGEMIKPAVPGRTIQL